MPGSYMELSKDFEFLVSSTDGREEGESGAGHMWEPIVTPLATVLLVGPALGALEKVD